MKGMLSCSNLIQIVRNSFLRIKDISKRKPTMSLVDNLMKSVYEITQAPSDTQMRERLDEVDPNKLRKTFQSLFGL